MKPVLYIAGGAIGMWLLLRWRGSDADCGCTSQASAPGAPSALASMTPSGAADTYYGGSTQKGLLPGSAVTPASPIPTASSFDRILRGVLRNEGALAPATPAPNADMTTVLGNQPVNGSLPRQPPPPSPFTPTHGLLIS